MTMAVFMPDLRVGLAKVRMVELDYGGRNQTSQVREGPKNQGAPGFQARWGAAEVLCPARLTRSRRRGEGQPRLRLRVKRDADALPPNTFYPVPLKHPDLAALSPSASSAPRRAAALPSAGPRPPRTPGRRS